MPGKVRVLDRGIQLSESVRAHVEYLAHLAGVPPSEIVNFVLSEVFESEGTKESPSPVPQAPAAPRGRARPVRRPNRPADVIPFRRTRSPRPYEVPSLWDTSYLRRQTDELLVLARAVRARAAQACHAADGARARATEVMHLALAAR